jgi:hypothetical protein
MGIDPVHHFIEVMRETTEDKDNFHRGKVKKKGEETKNPGVLKISLKFWGIRLYLQFKKNGILERQITILAV